MSAPGGGSGAGTGRLREVTRSGLTFDVHDEGPLDGVPVVLLHGFPERATCWRDVAPLLHAQGLRTVAVDQRGYAPRARPTRRRDYVLDELVADAAAVAAAVRESTGHLPHVVGHDWGAVVAWGLAGLRPAPVRSLTAVSVPHPAAFLRAGLHSPQLLRSWYMGLFNLPGVAERLARRPGGAFDAVLRRAGMGEADLVRFRAEIVDDGALPGALAWYRALPLSLRGFSPARVRVPTTFVWSDGDVAIARWGAEHCADFVTADYELVVLTGVTHWIPTQAAPALAEAVAGRVRGEEGAA